MPIKGLTENPSIPRLGKIRLGDQSGRNGAPVNKPHFVVPPEVAEVYGAEPTELRIVFLVDDDEVIASQYYRAYNTTNGLICKGDGEWADASLDADVLRKNGGAIELETWAHGQRGNEPATRNVVRQQIQCAGAECPMFKAKKCGIRAYFQFAVRDVPGLGVYQMDTGSVINVKRINGALEIARALLGGVAGVPMILSRLKTDVSPDGVKKSVWTVDLKVDTDYSLTRLLELRKGPVARVLLPPVDESEVYLESGDVEDELPALPAPVAVEPEKPVSASKPAATATEPRQASLTGEECEHDWTVDADGYTVCTRCKALMPESTRQH